MEGVGHTLKEHQSDTNMSPLETPLAEAVQVAPDMQHDPAEDASVLEPWMPLCTDQFAICNFRSDLDPFSQDSSISLVGSTQLAEGLERGFISPSSCQPARRIWKERNTEP